MDDDYYYDAFCDFPEDPVDVQCKFCGRTGLAWGQDDRGQWRLYNDSGRPHLCAKGRLYLGRSATDSDFDNAPT